MIETIAASEGPACLAYVQRSLCDGRPITEAGLIEHGMGVFDAKVFGGRLVRAEEAGAAHPKEESSVTSYPSLFCVSKPAFGTPTAASHPGQTEVLIQVQDPPAQGHSITHLSRDTYQALRRAQEIRCEPWQGVMLSEITRLYSFLAGTVMTLYGGVSGPEAIAGAGSTASLVGAAVGTAFGIVVGGGLLVFANSARVRDALVDPTRKVFASPGSGAGFLTPEDFSGTSVPNDDVPGIIDHLRLSGVLGKPQNAYQMSWIYASTLWMSRVRKAEGVHACVERYYQRRHPNLATERLEEIASEVQDVLSLIYASGQYGDRMRQICGKQAKLADIQDRLAKKKQAYAEDIKFLGRTLMADYPADLRDLDKAASFLALEIPKSLSAVSSIIPRWEAPPDAGGI